VGEHVGASVSGCELARVLIGDRAALEEVAHALEIPLGGRDGDGARHVAV